MIMAVASIVLSVLALLAAGWCYWRSDIHAKHSAAAATQAAAAAERSAAAADRQAALAVAAAERYEVPWRLTRAAGDMSRLTNTNRTETAYRATVEPVGRKEGQVPEAPQDEDIGPGEAREFFGIVLTGPPPIS